MKKNNKLIENNKGSISLLVVLTIFTFIAILVGSFLTVMALRKSQNQSNYRIQEKYLQDVERVDEVYEEIISKITLKKADIPEKSEESAFDRSYGVIEIEFLKDIGYEISDEPNEPKMTSDMKKVYWKDDGTEVLEGDEEFDETKWYSYIVQMSDTAEGGTSKWANAVTLDSSGNIEAYWVWIPRYAYRIVYFDTPEHEEAYRLTGATDGIVGYSDARGLVHPDGKTPSDMESPVTSIAVGKEMLRPHPVFEGGSETGYEQGEWEEALEGIWIAKYEMSGTSNELKSLPGVTSLRELTIADMYTCAIDYNTTKKSHMLKNSEWGAISYLTDSKYGRNGTAVTINSVTGYYTAGANGATQASNPLQSTTGNYYGIYDTVGCAYEYVAGYIADETSNYGNSFATTNGTNNSKKTSTKYATSYNMKASNATTIENYNLNINKIFGDALIETSTSGEGVNAWNEGDAYFVGVYNSKNYPFFIVGGSRSYSDASSFAFSLNKGTKSSAYGFRIALCIE